MGIGLKYLTVEPRFNKLLVAAEKRNRLRIPIVRQFFGVLQGRF